MTLLKLLTYIYTIILVSVIIEYLYQAPWALIEMYTVYPFSGVDLAPGKKGAQQNVYTLSQHS